ncbi:hypothetical protein BGZ83_011270 [Gryganskiella cystojenkinii]|nr:hypothetical protein BGZ83_011270 [Gryganskiella cystojenkinii]
MAYSHLRRMRVSILLFSLLCTILIAVHWIMLKNEASNPAPNHFYDLTISAGGWCAILSPPLTFLVFIYYLFAKREQELHQIELHRQSMGRFSQGAGLKNDNSNGGLLTWKHWLRFLVVGVLAGYILYSYFQEWVSVVQLAVAVQDIRALACELERRYYSRCVAGVLVYWFGSILGWLMAVEAAMTLWVSSGVYWRKRMRVEHMGGHSQQSPNVVIVSPEQAAWQQQQQQLYYPQQQQYQYPVQQHQPYYYNQQPQYPNQIGHKLDEPTASPIDQTRPLPDVPR